MDEHNLFFSIQLYFIKLEEKEREQIIEQGKE